MQQASSVMSTPDLSYTRSREALSQNNINKDGYTLGRVQLYCLLESSYAIFPIQYFNYLRILLFYLLSKAAEHWEK